MFFKGRSFFKSSDARGFLTFLLLTSMVAILIKLSKEYTKTYTIPITITKIPINKTVKSIAPSKIEFSAQLSGFSLLMNSFKNQKLRIEFSKLDSLSNNTFTYNTDGLNTHLKKAVSGAKEFSNVSASSISVAVDVLATKKVPVLADVSIDFEQGYNTLNPALIEPDSVAVVGSKSILDNLVGIQTKSKRLENVTNDVTLTLALDTLAIYKELRFSNTSFKYHQEVAKYTEGSFLIPVTIRGAQENAIKIFPREVLLYFVVSLEEYDAILPTDFEVLADFSTRNTNEEFIVLTISRSPSNVRNVRLETKQIKFIVVK